MKQKILIVLLMAIVSTSACIAQEPAGQGKRLLVNDNAPAATILIGDAVPESARGVAEKLNKILERASGIRLNILPEAEAKSVPEDHTIVVVGGGNLATSLGALDTKLTEETFVVKTKGRYVVFAGSDTVGPDFREGVFHSRPNRSYGIIGSENDSPATLWAVGYFLDRHLGVRWLWPGELGTVVPLAGTIEVPDMNIRERPAMVYRTLQVTAYSPRNRKTSLIGNKTAESVMDEAGMWQAWHRCGIRELVRGGHGWKDWWKKYHKKYPEIFAQLPKSLKHPYPDAGRIKLCVSHPMVEELFMQEWRENGRPNKVNVGPTDGQGYCTCDKCRTLDIPNTLDVADPMDIITNRDVVSLAGRYLDLWRRLLDRMRPENPNVQLRSLVYANYRIATDDFAPLGHPKDAFIGSYVNDNWSERERNSIDVWQDKIGIKLFLRPNDWHVGHIAPYLPLHKAGDFLKSALGKGLVGYAHDTVLGYWATQGINYYLAARLINYPDMTVDHIIDEYASGFGQAASAIKEYIAHWEAYSYKIGAPDWMGRFEEPDSLWKRTLQERGLNSDAFQGSWYMLPFLYTDDVLARGHGILDHADTLAGNDRVVLARIAFLRDGLRYLALARDVVALANNQIRNKPESAEEATVQSSKFERLRARLLNQHSSLTRRHVIWADVITQHEVRRRVKIGIRNFDPIAMSVATDWGQWRFRKDSQNAGIDKKWYRVDLGMDEAGWIPIQVPAFWDRTIGNYQGFGWYRTTFSVSPKWNHPNIRLIFGAVDEQAWIYLNGVFVGEHTIASESASDIEGARTITIGDMWDRSFTISVPIKHVKLGAKNTLVVRVHNEKASGGIHKPVNIVGPEADNDTMVLDTAELGDGLMWQPGEAYNDLNMARRCSARTEITVDEKTQGIIMEAGATDAGLALYVYDGHLYFQAGKGDEFPAEEGQALIRVPIKPGRHVVEWFADQLRSKTMLRVNGEVVGTSEKLIDNYLVNSDPGGIGGIHREEPSLGIVWHPGEGYTDFAMATCGSAQAEVTVDEKTQGIIMEAGATGSGVALYIYDGNLYYQAGNGKEFPAKDGQFLISVPISPGRHVIEWSADKTKAMLRVNGEVVGISEQPVRVLAGSDPGGIGGIRGGGICHNAGRWLRGKAGEFTGTIHSVTVWPSETLEPKDGVCQNAGGWRKNKDGEFTGTIHSVTVWPDKTVY